MERRRELAGTKARPGRSMRALLLTALALVLALGITGVAPREALAAAKAPTITVTRANTGRVTIKQKASYKLAAKASAGKLAYKSSKPKVASVSAKGVVKGLKTGSAVITITAKSGSKKAVKRVKVTVVAAKKYKQVKKVTAKVAKKTKATLAAGSKAKVAVAFSPKAPSNRNVTYKSNAPTVVSVSATGMITAKKAGTAKVTVTSCANAKAKATVTITVKKKETKPAPEPDAVELEESTVEAIAQTDGQVSDMLESDEFSNASLESRVEMAEQVLAQLTEDGCITEGTIHYDHDGAHYSFEYPQGIIGGVFLRELDPSYNGETSLEGPGEEGAEPDVELYGGSDVEKRLEDADVVGETDVSADGTSDTGREVSASDGDDAENDIRYIDPSHESGNETDVPAASVQESNEEHDGFLSAQGSPRGNKGKVLYLNTFAGMEGVGYDLPYDDNDRKKKNDDCIKGLRDEGFDVDVRDDVEVTIADFKDMGSYDIVILSTHGDLIEHMFYDDNRMPFVVKEPVIFLSARPDNTVWGVRSLTPEMVKQEVTIEYFKWGNSVDGSIRSGYRATFAVRPKFFIDYYGKGGLNGTFVCSQSCRFFGRSGEVCESMAKAMVDAGAEVVCGAVNNVGNEYGYEFSMNYAKGLGEGHTARKALEEAAVEQTLGSGTDGPEYFRLYGNEEACLTPKFDPSDLGVAPQASLDGYTWEQLKVISDAIAAEADDAAGLQIAKAYNLVDANGKLQGDTKDITLTDGTAAKIRILGFRHDDLADGGKAGISFEFADIPTRHVMNSTQTNIGGWEASDMRYWLNDGFYDLLPSDLRACIEVVAKRTNNAGGDTGGDTSVVTATYDKIWLLSLSEVYGGTSNWCGHQAVYDAEGTQYKLYADQGVTPSNRSFCKKSGSWIFTWLLRSPYSCDSYNVIIIDGDGYRGMDIANHYYGVAPGFCL